MKNILIKILDKMIDDKIYFAFAGITGNGEILIGAYGQFEQDLLKYIWDICENNNLDFGHSQGNDDDFYITLKRTEK